MAADGLVVGYPDGKFHGEEALTRYQYAMVIWRLVRLLDGRYVSYDAFHPVLDELLKRLDELEAKGLELEALRRALEKLARRQKGGERELRAVIDRFLRNDRELAQRVKELERANAYVLRELGQMRKRVDGLSTVLALTTRDIAVMDERLKDLEAWRKALRIVNPRDLEALRQALERQGASVKELDARLRAHEQEASKKWNSLDQRLRREESEAGFRRLRVEGEAYLPYGTPEVDVGRLWGKEAIRLGGTPSGQVRVSLELRKDFTLLGALGVDGTPLYGGAKTAAAEVRLGRGIPYEISPHFVDEPFDGASIALRSPHVELSAAGAPERYALRFSVGAGPLRLSVGGLHAPPLAGLWGGGVLSWGALHLEAEGWKDANDPEVYGYLVEGAWRYNQVEVRGNYRKLTANADRFAGEPGNERFYPDQEGYGLHIRGEGFFRLEGGAESYTLKGKRYLGYFADLRFGDTTYLEGRYARNTEDGTLLVGEAPPEFGPDRALPPSGTWAEAGHRDETRWLALRAGSDNPDLAAPYYVAAYGRIATDLGRGRGEGLFHLRYQTDGTWSAKLGARTSYPLGPVSLEGSALYHAGDASELLVTAGLSYQEDFSVGLRYAYYAGTGWSPTAGAPYDPATPWILGPTPSPYTVQHSLVVEGAALGVQGRFVHSWGGAGVQSSLGFSFSLEHPGKKE